MVLSLFKKINEAIMKEPQVIKKWKKEINQKQEKEIFDIIEKFDIDIYEFNKFIPNKKYLNFNLNK